MEQELEIEGKKYYRDEFGTLFDENRKAVTDKDTLNKANPAIANAVSNADGETFKPDENRLKNDDKPTADVSASEQAEYLVKKTNEKTDEIGKQTQQNVKANLDQLLKDNKINVGGINEHYTERVARSMWDRYKSGQIDKKQFATLLVDELATTLGNTGAAIAALGNVKLPTQQSQFDKIINTDLEGALQNYNKKMDAELEQGLKDIGMSNEEIQDYEKTIASAKMNTTDKGFSKQLEALNDKFAYDINKQIANAYRSMSPSDRTALLQYSVLLGKTQPETLPELAAVLSGQMDPTQFDITVQKITNAFSNVAGVTSDTVSGLSELLKTFANLGK